MSCPHSLYGDPKKCSQCIGATPTRIDQVGPDILVDGEPLRPIAPVIEPNVHQPRRQRRKQQP